MTAIRSQFSRLLQQRLTEQRQEILESLATGHDNNTYWRLVGVIQGLDDARKMTEEVDYNISGEEPDAGH